MTRRVMKKVLRRVRSGPCDYRYSTYRRAQLVWYRVYNGPLKRTPGGRWGRWDPSMPTPPWEPPF